MNLLSSPTKVKLIIKKVNLKNDHIVAKFGIMPKSIISVIKRIKKTGVVLAFKTNRIAIDEQSASKIYVKDI